MATTDIQKTPFVRELASSDRKTRDKALESLTLFLKARKDLSLLELLKVWKGLFFCFYHSDRPLTQQALARSLSYSLVPSLPRESRLRFLRAFWITIGREFHALDRLRLDKYLYLIRCYVGVAFEIYLKGKINDKSDNEQEDSTEKHEEEEENKKRKRKGDEKSNNGKRRKQSEENSENNGKGSSSERDGKWTELESYISLLEKGPLCPINFDPSEKKPKSNEDITMPHGPDGLRYHITDIWLDELEKVLSSNDDGDQDGKTEEVSLKDRLDVPIGLLLRPFERLRKESQTKSVRMKVVSEVLEDERLADWGFRERKKVRSNESEDDEEDEDEDDEWGGFDD
ncbi:ribosomal RNA processing protein, putative [Talaromyces stipitatus ATCC 10500]|uniref:Ribosomal RNA processing protein, putative n=1 Tax=Talaromyces stipitatus (strain ATCC 10500 / CBS 375.48 / QM 6759 / NRRL 1006) TaxID=441959 RepID=B8LVM9_TALSN|nr:ribosomal RNA processing protein, putative [Talaromyces stipitatus ATCC 10500]EED24159.1 ribosomal RNA processing protein, putative [Talaromyces stipitatus ATCC 10500]